MCFVEGFHETHVNEIEILLYEFCPSVQALLQVTTKTNNYQKRCEQLNNFETELKQGSVHRY